MFIDTHSNISYRAVERRVEANRAVANRVQHHSANRVQDNAQVTNRVAFQAVANRVAGNQPVANRVDIAA